MVYDMPMSTSELLYCLKVARPAGKAVRKYQSLKGAVVVTLCQNEAEV